MQPQQNKGTAAIDRSSHGRFEVGFLEYAPPELHPMANGNGGNVACTVTYGGRGRPKGKGEII